MGTFRKGHARTKPNDSSDITYKDNAQLEYPDPERDKVYGYGAPMSTEGAFHLMKQFKNQIKNNQPVLDFFKERFAFTIGKEAVLSILSQKGCDGIRIYFGYKLDGNQIKGQDGTTNDVGLTLIFFGADGADIRIGNEINNFGSDIGTTKNFMLDVQNLNDLQSGEARETVPPAKDTPLYNSIKNFYE